MAEGQSSSGFELDLAQLSADRLALALEEVGFDVGRAFPMLGGVLDKHGRPSVELGRLTAIVADQLSTVLSQAVQWGVSTSAEGG
jgi:hypothetical protein